MEKKKSYMDYLNSYCKCFTFGDEFFLAPLVLDLLRQFKYTAKCAFIKGVSGYKLTTKSNPF